MGFDRRAEDERIEQIHDMVKEIHQRQIEITLPMLEKHEKVIRDINDRIITVEKQGESTQKELTEHKSNHWQFSGIVVAISGVFAVIAAVIIEKLMGICK